MSCVGLLWDMVSLYPEIQLGAGRLIVLLVVYFFNDIYPSTHGGHRPLDPPQWWISLFDRRPLAAPETDVHAAALNRDIAAPAVPNVG